MHLETQQLRAAVGLSHETAIWQNAARFNTRPGRQWQLCIGIQLELNNLLKTLTQIKKQKSP